MTERSDIRWRRWAPVATLAISASLTLVAMPSLATHGLEGVFEDSDGNLENGTADGIDWNSFTDGGTATAWNFHRFNDRIGNPDDIFGGGVKQDHACPSTTIGSNGGGNSKFDLSSVSLANQNIDGDELLVLSWIRVPSSPTASSHIAYEFNKGTAGFCGGVTPPADQTEGLPLLNRVAGDLLVVYDFEGGEADSTVKLAEWLTAGAGGNAADCEVAKALPCWGNVEDLTAQGFAEANVNKPSVGNTLDAVGNATLVPVQFGEAGINLTDAGVFGDDSCDGFGYVTAVSRSSGNSGIAQMKDKVGTNKFDLAECEGSIVVEKVDEEGTRLGGATFEVDGTEMTEYADGVFCLDGLAFDTYTVEETEAPDGYTGADSQDVTVDEESTCDDRIDTDGEPVGDVDASFTNVPEPGDVEITKLDDDDNPLEGVTFELYADDGTGAITGDALDSCTTDSTGTCTIEDIEPGDYCVIEDESTLPSDFPYVPDDDVECFTIEVADGGDLVELTFVNPRTHKVIVIVCHEGTDTLAASDVTIDGTDVTSLAEGSANESTLCALDGVGGFEHDDDVPVSVDVGSDAHS